MRFSRWPTPRTYPSWHMYAPACFRARLILSSSSPDASRAANYRACSLAGSTVVGCITRRGTSQPGSRIALVGSIVVVTEMAPIVERCRSEPCPERDIICQAACEEAGRHAFRVTMDEGCTIE
jgi:hypothetical protein